MPTANSAAPAQPIQRSMSRYRRLVLQALGVAIGLALLAPAQAALPQSANAAASSACNGWDSTSRPPDRIRVLRVRTGRIVSVEFRKYVITVMGKEWPSYLPQAVVEAGAVAVKQYAWYHSLNPRRTNDGRCFDVRDSTGDQLYKPELARIGSDHYRAVDTTWGVHLIKDGRFFMTGYRRGNKGPCGSDATGWKLFARTATRCANNGKSYREILRIYYGPRLDIVSNGGGGGSVAASSTDTSSASSSSSSASTVSSTSSAGQVAPADTQPTPVTAPVEAPAETVVAVTESQLQTISTDAWRDLFHDVWTPSCDPRF